MDQARASSGAARAAGWAAALALAAAIWVLLEPTLASVGYQPGSDDGYYLHYMRELGEKGPGAFPSLFRFYLGDERHWIFPPPSRVGFVATSALWGELFGASFRSLSTLSLASHMALVVLVYAFAQRWFEVRKAVLVAALVATSTLGLGLARLALTDSFITLSQTAAICLFLEYVRDPGRKLRAVAFALAFGFAIATKEIAVLLALPFAAHAAVERWRGRRELPIGRTLALLVAPGAVAALLWVIAAGGVTPLFKVMKIVLLSPATNQYAIQYGSGGWYRYPIDELLMAPWPTLLGLAAIAVALWRWRKGEYDTLAVGLSLVYVCQVGVLGFFTKNLRYVAVLEVPLRVLAVVLLWELTNARHSRIGLGLTAGAVLLLAWLGWKDYELFWIQWKTNDPVTDVLVEVRQMIPTQPDGN